MYTPSMKIYFTSSTAEFNKYKDTYFTIRNYLLENEHILTRDWLPHTNERLEKNDTDVKDMKEIYKSCINAIKDADLVIVEDTISNFSTGHQITLSLQYKKPTLVLWKGKKHRQFKQMFIHGIDSNILEVNEYTEENLKDLIQVFLSKYERPAEKNRFHLVLNNKERKYLDWAQFRKGKSRTQIIRQALENTIDADEEYNNYLLSNNRL